MHKKVSIIVPTYNRCHLLGDTLDSVVCQSFQSWECIVVDDSSHDHTEELMEFYCERDQRIKFYRRPKVSIKGANSCRNFGFSKSTGDYIIWFDSDDLMTPDHIEKKIKAIQEYDSDFIIARTRNFNDCKLLEPYKYIKKPYGIKAGDFILLKIHWYTYDIILKREVAVHIEWNEHMRSWQDYNYFCKMLLVSENGRYLDEVLTHRRLHDNSIQTVLKRDDITFQKELLENRIFTFEDIEEKLDPYTRRELIFGMMNLCYDLARKKILPLKWKKVKDYVRHDFGYSSMILFNLAVISAFFFSKGFFILEQAKPKRT